MPSEHGKIFIETVRKTSLLTSSAFFTMKKDDSRFPSCGTIKKGDFFMDLIKEALSMGFADAAIMDTKDLVFVPEYRQFCEDNLCGNYNLVPACPPACGTVSIEI